jgi:acyl carrier protein
MLPQHIEVLPALPLTLNGKIDRNALPLPVAAVAVAQTAPATPAAPRLTHPREISMASIWRELIGVKDVRGDDNFFDLGGHSLLAVELVARVQREFGVRLNLLDIATGTLASLALELPGAAMASAATGGTLRMRFRRLLGFH